MGRSQKIGLSLEKRWSKKTNSKRTLASGAIWFDKEDSKNSKWLFQNKATDKEDFPFKLSDLKKLKINAQKTLRKFAFVIEFNSSNFAERTAYVIFPYSYIRSKIKKDKEFQKKEVNSFILNKQIKLSKNRLDENWLNEKLQVVIGKTTDDWFVIFNEIDFLKEFKGEFI